MRKLKEKYRALFSNRGCFGCCTKPPLIISVDEPSKGLKIQGHRVKKHSINEDFWSSSACEMDNSAFPSQRSVSSNSISNQVLDPNSSSGSTSNPPEFVNHGKYFLGLALVSICGCILFYFNYFNLRYVSSEAGLLLWNQTREQWVGEKGCKKPKRGQEPKLCLNATYDNLLGTSKPFPRPIPLPEMVDFLVDIWEQEGLYD